MKPTKFLGVPRVWEKIKDKMQEAGRQAGPIQKAVVQWAKNAATHRQHETLMRCVWIKVGFSQNLDGGNAILRW